MVKGISKQVIVVHSPEQKMFEQAIFILKDGAPGEGITDEALLREAQQLIRGSGKTDRRRNNFVFCMIWAFAGAFLTAMAWLLTVII